MTTYFDPSQVRKAFNTIAADYETTAFVQKAIGERLMARLTDLEQVPHILLDLGCGAGFFYQKLKALYPMATLIGLDFAIDMLRIQQIVDTDLPILLCADAMTIPLADNSVDLVFSNLMLQWCLDFPKAMAEIHRVLSPNGYLIFSTLGPETFSELRQAWRAVDDHTHVHEFQDLKSIGDTLLALDFSVPVVDKENLVIHYEDVKTMMLDIKSVGAYNQHPNRQKGLTGKQKMLDMMQQYEKFRENGKLPLRYEIIYGHARKQVVNKADKNTIQIPLSVLKETLK